MYSTSLFTRNIRGDIFGGITAAIIALPLALAFGISSGAGAAAGLYGAIILGFFSALFGGTPAQISGPTGPMTIVMAVVISSFIAKHPDSGFALVFTTVFLGGLIQIIFGYCRLGKYIVLIPYPVISGFMTGIGVIIILLQLAPLLGQAANSNVTVALQAIPHNIRNIQCDALLIGLLAFLLMIGWRGVLNRIIPAPLAALIISTVTLNYALPGSLIDRIGEIPSAFPKFYIPCFRWDILKEMFVNAFMLATLGAIDSLITSIVADNIQDDQHDSDQELIGQGLGNAIAGLFGGLPGAGATMRTVSNMQAGGSGPLSGITHACILLAIVAGAGFIFEDIPMAALAGILLKVGIDIIDWPFIRRLHRFPMFPVVLMGIVFLLTIFFNLMIAVLVGVFIKNIATIQKLTDFQLRNVILSNGIDNNTKLTLDEKQVLGSYSGQAFILKFIGPISYAVGRGLLLRLKNLQTCKYLFIDLQDATFVGVSTIIVLESIIMKIIKRDICIKIIDSPLLKRKEIQQLGLTDLIGDTYCVNSICSLDQLSGLHSKENINIGTSK